jgi:predicted unusual protein kinase regulating ubiquinone biosynthesis (AarF/ABC1/UbiB family)
MASRLPETLDRDAFEGAVAALVSEYSPLRAREFEVSRFVYRLIEAQRRHGIRGSTKFMMTILSMVVFDGICKQLYPDCDFQAEARGYLLAAKYGGAKSGGARRPPAPGWSPAHGPDSAIHEKSALAASA